MIEPVRILHCVVNMNRGGAETLLMNLYRNIDREKVQFDFLTSKEGVFDEEIISMGGRVHRIPYLTEVGIRSYTRIVRKFLQDNKQYQIIHSHMDKMSGLILKEAQKEGVPIRIAHSHNTRSEGNLIHRLIKGYYGSLISYNANRYFACSDAAAKFLFKTNDKVYIVNNGIQVDNFIYCEKVRKEVLEEIGLNNKFIIGHIGRFNEQKNHKFLLRVFKEIYELNNEARLVLVGNGVLQDEIKNKAEALGIAKQVNFIGNRNDVNRLLQAFDVLLFPSLFEGLPVTIIEAQASGLKCILSDTITKEVDKTGNIEFISLNKDAKYWAQMVRKYEAGYERKNMKKYICDNKYDIREIAQNLEKRYLDEFEGVIKRSN